MNARSRRVRAFWWLGAALWLAAGTLAVSVGAVRARHREIEGAPERPAVGNHRESVFQDLAGAGIAALARAQDEPFSCKTVRASEFRDRPDELCRNWVDLHWPAAALVLSTTQARLVFPEVAMPADEVEGRIVAARVGALQVLLDQERGESARALETCLGILGLGREAASAASPLGDALGSAIVGGVFRPCATVLNDAPAEARTEAATAIGALATALPPASHRSHSEALAQVAPLLEQPAGSRLNRLLDEDAMVDTVRLYEAIPRVAELGNSEPRPAILWNEWLEKESHRARAGTPLTESLCGDHEVRVFLKRLQQLAANRNAPGRP